MTATPRTGYRPGVCNIGTAEIRRRRLAGHVGLVATLIVFGGLVAVDAPPLARRLVAVPAAAAATGYLQAQLTFCVAFGSRGIFNFGSVGPTESVVDAEARTRDRARARQIALGSLAIGAAVGVAAALLGL